MRARVIRFAAAFQALLLMATLIVPALTSAAVWTDQADYAPGSVVTISGDNSNGAGYIAGESVHVAVLGPNGWTAACDGTADEFGAWSCEITLDSNPDVAVGSYTYTASGQLSGFSESGTFTDAVTFSMTALTFVWHRFGEVTDGFDIAVAGKYTCSAGGGANNCNTITDISLTVAGGPGTVSGSKVLTGLTLGTDKDWGTTLEFRNSPGTGQFGIPTADGKYNITATFHTNQNDKTAGDDFGYDHVAPASSITCNNNPCGGLYPADVTIKLDATDPGAANTFSGVASTLYCVDLLNTCTPNTAYPGGGGTNVARVSGATKYVRFYATDVAGNVEATQSQAITFTTDDEAPSVSSTSPSNGATGVAVGSSIVITFSEAVTLDPTNAITVECPAGTPVAGSTSGAGTTWTFDPTANLPADTVCAVTVHSNQVEDDDLNDPPDAMDPGNYQFSFRTQLLNQAPTVDAGDADGAYSGNEGSAISLDGTVTDPDVGDIVTVLWSVAYNGNMDAGGACTFANATSVDTTVTCTDDSAGGSFTLTLTANDGHGHVVSDTATLTVANVAPTVALNASNPLSVTESNATEHTYQYTRSDAGTNDALSSTPSCGSAGTLVAGSLTATSFKCKFVDGGPTPPGTDTTVSIYATDDEGANSTTASQTVNISNANPVVLAPHFTATQVCQGSTATLTGISFSDAGVNDDPWAINIDWGDGSADYQANVATQGAQSDVSPTYNVPGTYPATITVTDKDGGIGSNTSSNSVTVVPHYSITFRQPVDGTIDGTISNSVKLGRVVPVKILVWDNCANDFAGGYVTDPAAIVRIAAGLAPGAGGTLLDSVEAYADAGSANNNTLLFRWTADLTAPGGGFWIYNLDTKNSIQTKFVLGSTYRIDAYINGFLAAGSTSQHALLYMQK